MNKIIALSLSVSLAACSASQATLDEIGFQTVKCNRTKDTFDCLEVYRLQAKATQEAKTRTGLLIALPLIVGAVVLGAVGPKPPLFFAPPP